MLDKFKSIALEGYIKNKFPQYLENGDISVDLKVGEARCAIKATLAGETQPVCINIAHFDVVDGENGKCLRITEVSSDRKWLDSVLNDILKNRDIKLPSFAADALCNQ